MSDEERPPASQTPDDPPRPKKLKITLRLNKFVPPSAPSSTAPTPTAATSAAPTPPAPTPSKRPQRRIMKRKRTPSDDEVESEDDESAGDYFNPDADEDDESSRAPSRAPRLTARQAAMAKTEPAAGDPALVALDLDAPTRRGKKATLTETELAMKKEESARKRRNLTEKKLEDEKQETINRLLRKQGRRGAKEEEEDEDDDAEEDADAPVVHQEPAVPMFRWVSSARGITFSVPEAWLPAEPAAPMQVG